MSVEDESRVGKMTYKTLKQSYVDVNLRGIKEKLRDMKVEFAGYRSGEKVMGTFVAGGFSCWGLSMYMHNPAFFIFPGMMGTMLCSHIYFHMRDLRNNLKKRIDNLENIVRSAQ